MDIKKWKQQKSGTRGIKVSIFDYNRNQIGVEYLLKNEYSYKQIHQAMDANKGDYIEAVHITR